MLKSSGLESKPNLPLPSSASPGACASCQQFDYRICHREKGLTEPDSTCPSWEARKEREGMTIWEVITREG